jgi:LysM repeat protein
VIELANPEDNPSSLQVGEVIQLQVPSSSSTYTIQAGDTLNAISTKFGTTVAVLEAINPTVNPSNLQVGAQIIIPATVTPAPVVAQPSAIPAVVTPLSNATYTIQSGDTFNSIAAKLGIAVASLEAANPTVNINNLQVGSQISVPSSTTSVSVAQPTTPAPSTTVPSTSSRSTYTVQAGDTFFLIATEFGIIVVALQAANPIAEGAGLTVGSQITIPTSSTSIVVTSTPVVQVLYQPRLHPFLSRQQFLPLPLSQRQRQRHLYQSQEAILSSQVILSL